MKKGQESLAAMIGVSIIFIIVFTVYFVLANPNEDRSLVTTNYFKAKTICEKLQFSIDGAITGGNGFQSMLELPEKLNGNNYTIEVHQNRIYIRWSDQNYLCPFYAGDIILKANESWEEVKVGYLQKENCLTQELQKFNTTIYCNDATSIDCPEIPTPCTNFLYKLTWSMTRFFSELGNYDVLFIEDPHFKTLAQLQSVETEVHNGTALFMSEHVSKTPAFGMAYINDCGNKFATVVNSDPLVSFKVGDKLVLSEQPCLDGSLLKIATYDDTGKPGISKITYGDGFVFYYSDYDGTIGGSESQFHAKVIENLNLTVNYVATYLKPVFEITERTILVQNTDDTIYIDQTVGVK